MIYLLGAAMKTITAGISLQSCSILFRSLQQEPNFSSPAGAQGPPRPVKLTWQVVFICLKPGLSQTPLGANAKAIQILSDLKVGDGGRVQCEWNVLNSNEYNHLQQSISKHLALHRKLHQVHLPLHIKQCSSAGTTPVQIYKDHRSVQIRTNGCDMLMHVVPQQSSTKHPKSSQAII